VTTLFPIGPDLTTLEPQVDGIVGTVAGPPAEGAALEANEVVAFCADKDPCNVVILIGQLQFPFDNVRYQEFNRVLDEHDNIVVVATGEGSYDRDASLTVMTDILQSHPDIDVVLSNADQHLSGAEIAIIDAGLDLEALYLIGGGATVEAIDAIRAGRWDATYANYPKTMGVEATKLLVAELRGEDHVAILNMDEFVEIGPIVTTQLLLDNPDFEGEWQG
jgi:ribose transport system substrate-binding protein